MNSNICFIHNDVIYLSVKLQACEQTRVNFFIHMQDIYKRLQTLIHPSCKKKIRGVRSSTNHVIFSKHVVYTRNKQYFA